MPAPLPNIGAAIEQRGAATDGRTYNMTVPAFRLRLARKRAHNSSESFNYHKARSVFAMKHRVANFVAAPVPDRENVVVGFDVGTSLPREKKRQRPERQPCPHGSPLSLTGRHRAGIYDAGSENRARGDLERSASRNQLDYFDPLGADDQTHRTGVFEAIEPVEVSYLYSGSVYPAGLNRSAKRHAAPYALRSGRAIRSLTFLAVDGSHSS